ncbi:Hypp2251 [Branchiostoma lanceolatum]|uniref:Hypp2251 protein n=1 Tax=Branchiostoma lanceolatum TaxID=7740 RepID=A0A8J9ZSG4_BRALA|nr:Hypp2251 [Branchiostoma lanceolatum]
MPNVVIFLLLLLLCFQFREGTGVLSCYSCDEEFKFYYYDTMCQSEVTRDNSTLSDCGSSSRYCMIERTKTNGVILAFSRGCSETCYWGCRTSGLGMTTEICTWCCAGNGCNYYSRAADLHQRHQAVLTVMRTLAAVLVQLCLSSHSIF